jgi:hypothetical protein
MAGYLTFIRKFLGMLLILFMFVLSGRNALYNFIGGEYYNNTAGSTKKVTVS